MAINSEMILIWVKSKMLHGMKRIISNVMLVAAAAMAFFACQKQEEFQPEFEEVNGLAFTSEKPSFDDETKTHWTGETIQWSKGDNIRVAYTCGGVWQDANGNPEPGNYGKLYASKELSETTDVANFVVPGTFKGSEQGDYKFYGIYPSTLTSSTDLSSAPSVSIDIPSEQTPAVNSFDAKADVMVAQSDIYNGMPKNGEENGSISLKWNRLVAHGYITLKSLPVDGQEVVKSIVLTADAEADMVGKHKVNFNTQEVEKDGSNATNSIAINGTNLTIDANGNVTFWACFLPCTWNSISVSVETDKATYTLERDLVALDKTKTFAKNARNVLAINMTEADRTVKNASSLPFVQDFSGMTGQSEITELEGFSSIGGKVYNATGAIRLASGSADGSITTQLLDLSQNFHVKVTASGWDDNELALIVSTSEPSYTETVTLTAFGGGENFAEHIINFQPVSNSASLTFTAKEDVRCYIKKIEILEGHAVAAPVLKATAPNEIAAAGGEGSFNFTLANPQDGQSVSAESNVDWITVESVSGNTVTYTVAENTSEEPREGTITLSYEGAESVDVTITQAAKPSADAPVEVTDVLTRATTGVSGTNYKDWTYESTTTSAKYAGNSAGGNESIQLRSNNSNSGIVTTVSAGVVKKIVVTWNANTASDRQLEVYGKSSAYTNASELYSTSTQGTKIGTINCGTSELVIDGNYQYVGLRSKSGAMYLSEIQIVWEGANGGSGESPSEPEPEQKYLTVSKSVFNVTADQTSVTFDVNANVGWGLEESEGVETQIVGVSDDELVMTVEVTFPANETAEPKTHTVTFIPEELDENVTVTINQAAKVEVDDSFEPGEYWIVANGKYAMPVTSNYDYLQVDDAGYKDNVFTFKKVENGYTIQQSDDKYLYMKGTYNNFNVSATAPTEGHIWIIAQNEDGSYKILNVLMSKYIQLDSQYGTYGSYDAVKGTMPNLVPADDAKDRPVFSVTSTSKSVACDVTEASFEIVSNQNWTVVPGAGVSVDVTSGSGNGTITMTFAENKSEENVNYTAIVKADGLEDIVLTVVQSGIPTGDVTETVVDLTWTLGTNAYDNTSSGNSQQTATINGVNYSNLLKLGTSSKSGSASIKLPAGTTKVTYSAVAWKGASCTLKFTVGGTAHTQKISANDGATGNPKYTITSTSADNYELVVSVDQETTMTVTTTSAVRAILWDLKAVVVN